MQAGVLPPAPNAANLTRVLAMGANGAGQLGIGTLTAQRQLTSIEYLVGQGAVGVACGGRHSLVLAEQGWVFAFGSNEEGQLGLGATERAPLPGHCAPLEAPIPTIMGVCQASAPSTAACPSRPSPRMLSSSRKER